MPSDSRQLSDQGVRTYYAAHFVEQPGPGYGVRVVLAADVDRLRAALEETVDLCNSLREYAPTLNMAAEKRLRDSLALLGRREALNGGDS